MRHEVARVKNVQKLADVVGELSGRDPSTPGIGLVWGRTGFGKTTATKHIAVAVDAVFVRALATWTPTAMLTAIMRELGSAPLASSAAMVLWIANELTAKGRALFVDEADFLVNKKVLVESLRDLHDLSTMPVVLIGMEDFKRSVMHRAQLAGRISQWVEFKAADEDDVRILAEKVCEVKVDGELLRTLHEQTQGSMRGLVVGLSRIESYARKNNVGMVTAQAWGDRELILRKAA